MRQILSILTIVAVFGLCAVPVVAEEDQYNCGNNGMVCNVQISKTNTGVNGVANGASFDDSDVKKNDDNIIDTGQALSFADAKTMINSNAQQDCCQDQENFENGSFVKNIQMVEANTGVNGIANSIACDESDVENNDNNQIWTGYAQSVASAKTVANSNISDGCCVDQDIGRPGGFTHVVARQAVGRCRDVLRIE